MSGKRQKVHFQKFEKASRTSWSLTYWGSNSVTKIGSFLFPRRPDCHFWKLRIISLSPKRLWISVTWNFSLTLFDSKIKMNLEEEIYTECLFLWHSQFLEYEEISDSRIFFGSTSEQSKCPSRDFPLLEQRFPPLEPSATPS